jgi:hypothetical protein
MFAFTKTLIALALGATAIGGATWAATTGLGGLQMSPASAPVAGPWQGYSIGWDNAGWQCISDGAGPPILIGLQPASNDWDGMALAGCHNSWAYPFLSATKTQHAESFERRYVGVRMPRRPVIE